jgi:hypothetical protein
MHRMEGKREKSPNEVKFSPPLYVAQGCWGGGGGQGEGVRDGFQFIAKISATWPSFQEFRRWNLSLSLKNPAANKQIL